MQPLSFFFDDTIPLRLSEQHPQFLLLSGGTAALKHVVPLCGEAQVIAQGGTQRPYDSGNANAVAYKDKHYITYYSGDSINCKVVVAVSKYINK